MKREILIIIVTALITAVITAKVMFTLLPELYYASKESSQLTKSTSAVGTFETIDCKDCKVLRITESVWNGPIAKAGPDKVWEILAKSGTKTSTADWSLEILSVSADNLKIKFSGKIYQDGKPITKPIVITKWSKSEEFNDNRIGGGIVWDFVYFQKTD